ncbi:hypothetical protein BJ508DRAFT_88436 [Ascobolus immersus RN42]|uniref:Uncharacterized protein n=1 Tax=Ascobolus immersus RN42 TaxID=1160509 RepID=A0A3N4I8K2_ASCIM|nr:hypothetical protein BJ508DRAFT_88436 [Ascobolus immersus RN42]
MYSKHTRALCSIIGRDHKWMGTMLIWLLGGWYSGTAVRGYLDIETTFTRRWMYSVVLEY